MLFFFYSGCPPNGQRICTDGTSLVISSNPESQSYLPPTSSISLVDCLHSWTIVGSSGSLAVWKEVGTSTLPFPPFLPKAGADTSSRCQFLRPLPAARLSGSRAPPCPSFLPPIWPPPCTTCQHAQAGRLGRQTTPAGQKHANNLGSQDDDH